MKKLSDLFSSKLRAKNQQDDETS